MVYACHELLQSVFLYLLLKLSELNLSVQAQDCRRNAYRDARQRTGWEKSSTQLVFVMETAIEVIEGSP
jgi:hypothetical protein